MKMEKGIEECLDDLYRLGVVQGEHNINWADEYNLIEHSKNYYLKIKSVADKYGVESSPKECGDEYMQWDRMGFHLNEITREHILETVKGIE